MATETTNKIDVKQLKDEKLPQVTFPGNANQVYRVFFEPGVHESIWKHAGEDSSVEICGVLVGRYVRDGDGPFVQIDGSIRGEKATSKFAEVTFTHETWAKIHEQMDSKFADRVIVGWYHSHPDFGIFLSDRDRFIQEHFFSSPGQVAYVVDPIRKTEGVFVWRKGKAVLTEHYWVGSRIQVPTPSGEEHKMPAASGGPATATAAQPATGQATPEELPLWLSILSQVGLWLLILGLGWMLGGRWVEGLKETERQRIENNTMARAMLFLKIRPDLNEDVTKLALALAEFDQKQVALANQHLKLAEGNAETRKEYAALRQSLVAAVRQLVRIQETYCLTDKELELLEQVASGKLRGGAEPSKTKESSKSKEQPKSKEDSKAKEEEKPKEQPSSKEGSKAKDEEKPKEKATEEKPKAKVEEQAPPPREKSEAEKGPVPREKVDGEAPAKPNPSN